jgi:hypothetical protein
MFGPARASAEDTREEVGRFRPHVLAVDWVLSGTVVAGEAAGVPVALLMHGNNLVPEPGKPAPGFGFLPARSVLGRARDRVFTAIFRRLLDRGLPALNQARQALGLRPLGHVLEQLDRPARFLCLYSEAFDLRQTASRRGSATSGRCWSSPPGPSRGPRRGRRTTGGRWWWSA